MLNERIIIIEVDRSGENNFNSPEIVVRFADGEKIHFREVGLLDEEYKSRARFSRLTDSIPDVSKAANR